MTRILCGLVLLSSLAAFAHDDGPDDGVSWVVVRSDQNSTMHGDLRDLKVARKYLKEFGPGYLWFRRDGKEYVVRDGKVIEQIEDAVRPQEELGSEQARLGQRQADLGQQQAKLGQQQSELGQKQALKAMEQAQRGLNGEKESREDRESQRELEKLQNYLGKMQETLGREQEKIGHEQEKMGHQQERMSRDVQRKVEELIEVSLKNGSAKAVN